MTGPNPDDLATAVAWLLGQRLLSDPAELHRRLTNLEARMSLSETALADLDQATNEVADELDQLRAEIAGSDAALAGRISAAAERLRGLAADPANPVPPAGGGGTPAA